MTAEQRDHGVPDEEVNAREIRETFRVRVARLRAELTSTWNKLSQTERDPERGDR